VNRLVVIALPLSVLWCAEALAHEDAIFPIDDCGNMDMNVKGIGEEFSPASILVWAPGDPPPEVILTLGTNEVHMPPCIAKLFILPAGQQMRATGSWWHDFDSPDSSPYSPPPYIVFALPQSGSAASFDDGYRARFDLRNAGLIEVNKREPHPKGWREKTLDLKTLCSSAELERLAVSPWRSPPDPHADRESGPLEPEDPHDICQGLVGGLWCTLAPRWYWVLGALALAVVLVVALRLARSRRRDSR